MELTALTSLTNTPLVAYGSDPQVAQTTGTRRLSEALRPGHEMTQEGLGTMINHLDRLKLNISEGERAALQMHVSQFGALVTLAMNVSLGIGKACEKLQQA